MCPAERLGDHGGVTAADAIGAAAALVRFSALGGSLILPLVGLASAAGSDSGRGLVLALVIGVAFHVSVYVLNDVVDLPIDRTDPRRTTSPLVTELVSPAAATVLSILMFVVALGAAAEAGGPTVAAVVAAFVGLGAYDLLGKRTRWPPVTDLVQALGWASLVLAGAWAGGGSTTLSLAIAVYVALFILMANGVHGAIRDLPNDGRHGVLTTAFLLGARVTTDGHRIVPRRVMVYAWALQAMLLGSTAVAVIVAGGSALAAIPSAGAIVLLGGASRARTDVDLRSAGMLHLLVALTVPIALVVGWASTGLLALIAGIFVLPLLWHGWLPTSLAWGLRRTRQAARYGGDLFVLSRPHNALAAGIAVIVGAHLGGRTDLVAVPVVAAAFTAFLVVAAANVANDRADVVEDRINRPTRPIANGRVTPRAAAVVALVLAGGGVLLALTLGPAAAIATLILIATSFAYSVSLKGAFLVGNVVVGTLSASAILFGALVLGAPTYAAIVGAAYVFLSILSSEVLKSTADRDGDRAAGRRTIATTVATGTCLRIHAVLVATLIVLILVPSLTGAAPQTFLVAGLLGVVGPQSLVLWRLRGATDPADVRPVLPLAKVAWFTGLAALVFLA